MIYGFLKEIIIQRNIHSVKMSENVFQHKSSIKHIVSALLILLYRCMISNIRGTIELIRQHLSIVYHRTETSEIWRRQSKDALDNNLEVIKGTEQNVFGYLSDVV